MINEFDFGIWNFNVGLYGHEMLFNLWVCSEKYNNPDTLERKNVKVIVEPANKLSKMLAFCNDRKPNNISNTKGILKDYN